MVDFPEPLGPTKYRSSPGHPWKDTSEIPAFDAFECEERPTAISFLPSFEFFFPLSFAKLFNAKLIELRNSAREDHHHDDQGGAFILGTIKTSAFLTNLQSRDQLEDQVIISDNLALGHF